MASAETVARLKERLRRWEGEFRGGDGLSSEAGWEGAFPRGGLRRGTLVEWLREEEGGPAEAVSLGLAARLVAEEGGTLVAVDRERTFFPPAALALGVEPRSIVLVRPREELPRF